MNQILNVLEYNNIKMFRMIYDICKNVQNVMIYDIMIYMQCALNSLPSKALNSEGCLPYDVQIYVYVYNNYIPLTSYHKLVLRFTPRRIKFFYVDLTKRQKLS